MKIAVAIGHMTKRGGAQRQAIELVKSLNDLGHDAKLFCFYGDKSQCFPDLFQKVPNEIIVDLQGIDSSSKFSIKRYIHSIIIKFHFANTLFQFFQFYKSYKSVSKGIFDKINCSGEKFDVINLHEDTVWAAELFKKNGGPPTIWQANDPTPKWLDMTAEVKNKFLFKWVLNAIKRYLLKIDAEKVSHLDRICVLDTRNKNLVEEVYDVPSEIVRTGLSDVFLGERIDKHEARRKLNLPEDKIIVLAATILAPWRRLDIIIEAMADIGKDDVIFYLSGPSHWYPEYADKLAKLAKRKNFKKNFIHNEGNLKSDQDLLELYCVADIFVFPNDNQTWGLAAIEAAATGVATVISTGSGVSEVFNDNENTLLFYTKESLEKQLTVLIEDNEKRKEIAQSGKKFTRSTYSWGNYASAMVDCFNSAIDDKKEV